MSIALLVTIELDPWAMPRIEEAGFRPIRGDAAPTAAADFERGAIRAVLTNGSVGLDAAAIESLPALEIVCAIGAGHENIDLAAARARGIAVTHGRNTNDAVVADHALALMSAAARGIVAADRSMRQGIRQVSRLLPPQLSGKKLGILGLGTIGSRIARRAAAGFEMQIAYHNRRPRADVPWLHLPSPTALARWADYLIVATPGGAETRHLVDAGVLEALGASGFLVNIARGSVVDTPALIEALERGGIAGAGLDVVEGEPNVPAELLALSNVVLTPHVAGRSPESAEAMIDLAIANLRAHFDGFPVHTPVP